MFKIIKKNIFIKKIDTKYLKKINKYNKKYIMEDKNIEEEYYLEII